MKSIIKLDFDIKNLIKGDDLKKLIGGTQTVSFHCHVHKDGFRLPDLNFVSTCGSDSCANSECQVWYQPEFGTVVCDCSSNS
jgi:hypothetical protein